jgi:hypothetical protein
MASETLIIIWPWALGFPTVAPDVTVGRAGLPVLAETL